MTLEDYKDLMKFHLFMADFDISEFKYAAVDKDGDLCVFYDRPILAINDGDETQSHDIWYIESINYKSRSYEYITELESSIHWKDTLIEL